MVSRKQKQITLSLPPFAYRNLTNNQQCIAHKNFQQLLDVCQPQWSTAQAFWNTDL